MTMIGHNNPPDPIDTISAPFEDQRGDAENWLDGKTVIENAELPGLPATGPLAFQHHGGFKDGKYNPASSLVQFRNISIKEL